MATARSRLGVDVGGTFTDAVWMDEATGAFRAAKVPSTPPDLAKGFRAAARFAAGPEGLRTSRLVVHATTLPSNLLLEGKVAPTALLTTRGFEDVLEIGNQVRPRPYDLLASKAAPLVPRRRRFGVRERIAWDGTVEEPLDEAGVRGIAAVLRRDGVEALAISFLFAHANPVHERRARTILEDARPGLFVSTSSDLCPEYREFWRTSTTAVNAAVAPALARYLAAVEKACRAWAPASTLYVMRSDGGTMTGPLARDRPVHILESGPAAGAVAATEIGRRSGLRRFVSLDMGGTTAKVCMMSAGSPTVVREFEVGARGHGRYTGEGYAVKVPTIDLVEVGAGGGSIASIDRAGGLKVGPRSAGADPGPACYGRGGREPTLTDAYVVLGRIRPEAFLGGRMTVNVRAARRAIARIADPLGMDPEDAAHAILRVAEASMVAAFRRATVARGEDPRGFSLIAFGGAGPTQALSLAREIGVREVLIPRHPGVTSALGLLLTDLRVEHARTLLRGLDGVEPGLLARTFAELEATATKDLRRQGIPAEDIRLFRWADLRYRGQAFELAVSVPTGRPAGGLPGTMAARFHRAHARAYGHASPGEPIEVVVVRVVGVGLLPRLRWKRIPASKGKRAIPSGAGEVYFGGAGWRRAKIYARSDLRAGAMIPGPALVEQLDTTTVIDPGLSARVDPLGNLRVAMRS